MKDFLELVMNRRSIRKFKDEKPSKELIEKVVRAGLLAPTSKNKKPVEFIIVENKELLLQLKDCKSKGTIGLDTATYGIVIMGDMDKSDVWVEDASIAASYIQLEAEDLGLGSVWLQIRKRFSDNGDSEDEVKKILNIPSNYGVLCILALGYKDEIRNSYNIEDVDNTKVHFGEFRN